MSLAFKTRFRCGLFQEGFLDCPDRIGGPGLVLPRARGVPVFIVITQMKTASLLVCFHSRMCRPQSQPLASFIFESPALMQGLGKRQPLSLLIS